MDWLRGSKIGVDVFQRRETAVYVAVRAELTVRVAAGVDFAQCLDVDVGVNLCGLHPGMPQHFLNISDVGTAAMHVGGAGVSPQMAGSGLVDAAALHQFFNPIADIPWAEALAVTAEK